MYLELYRRKWNIIIIGHPGLFGVLNGKTAYNTYLIGRQKHELEEQHGGATHPIIVIRQRFFSRFD